MNFSHSNTRWKRKFSFNFYVKLVLFCTRVKKPTFLKINETAPRIRCACVNSELLNLTRAFVVVFTVERWRKRKNHSQLNNAVRWKKLSYSIENVLRRRKTCDVWVSGRSKEGKGDIFSLLQLTIAINQYHKYLIFKNHCKTLITELTINYFTIVICNENINNKYTSMIF